MKSTLLVLFASVICTSAFSQASPKGEDAWKESFPAFLEHLADIFNKNPKWPDSAPGLAFESTNDKNETIWLIPQMYPIGQVDGTGKFLWKSVTWDLTVDSVEEGKEGEVFINFKNPDLSKIHPGIKEFDQFYGGVKESQRPQARSLKHDQIVRVRGTIDGQAVSGGMLILLGVGPNEGKLQITLRLDDVELLDSPK